MKKIRPKKVTLSKNNKIVPKINKQIKNKSEYTALRLLNKKNKLEKIKLIKK
jgi:hypothetical protein